MTTHKELPPLPDPPPPDPRTAFQVTVLPVARPDGSNWIQVAVMTDVTMQAFQVPPDLAEQLAAGLPDMLLKATEQARRANMGVPANPLIVPKGHVK